MAEVLRSFTETIRDGDGEYHARVVGRAAADGRWEGWMEFVPLTPGGGETLVSPVESRQPEREHLVYWASGLSPIYAEGSLRRARRPVVVRTRVLEVPASDAPAPRFVTTPDRVIAPDTIFDPFEVGARNLDILRQELGALGRGRLVNIIAAYDIDTRGLSIPDASEAQLIEVIVEAVEESLVRGSRL
jgi:hypothetical protein